MNAPARWWHPMANGRVQCDLCPRECQLQDGQRGLCFVRQRLGNVIVLTTWGRSSGFCLDPIEKKPLNHFYPGSSVLSFGTAGCNLTCRFCQNWAISHARSTDRLQTEASPEAIARAAQRLGARSVAATYNDPVIFAEYAIATAEACRSLGVASVAVTAGYIHPPAGRDFFGAMDAANIDLKSFRDDFYRRYCGGRLSPVLDTLCWVYHESPCWLEITTLIIPGLNDSPLELQQLTHWVAQTLGPEVPVHFTAFHPDGRMRDRPRTPLSSLRQARAIAHDAGLRHVYLGNVREPDAGSTRCTGCGQMVIDRQGYEVTHYSLTESGCCHRCRTPLAGHFDAAPGHFGATPMRVAL